MIAIDVQKQLGDFTILARFQSQVRGIVALFGQSGSGKTSIINMLAGLLEPDSGRIEIDGVEVEVAKDLVDPFSHGECPCPEFLPYATTARIQNSALTRLRITHS